MTSDAAAGERAWVADSGQATESAAWRGTDDTRDAEPDRAGPDNALDIGASSAWADAGHPDDEGTVHCVIDRAAPTDAPDDSPVVPAPEPEGPGLPESGPSCGAMGCGTQCPHGYITCDPRAPCGTVPWTDVAHCGGCGRECAFGEPCVAGNCVTRSARPVRPMSFALVNTLTPRLAWTRAEGVDGVVIELCTSRDCARILRRIEVRGVNRVTLEPLEYGVYHWRLRGLRGAVVDARPSATWQFTVGPALGVLTPQVLGGGGPLVSPQSGRYYQGVGDTNGDGYLDGVVTESRAIMADGRFLGISLSVLFAYGSPVGAIEVGTIFSARSRESSPSASVGDVEDANGDGHADFILHTRLSGGSPLQSQLWLGRRGRTVSRAGFEPDTFVQSLDRRLSLVGDFDDDDASEVYLHGERLNQWDVVGGWLHRHVGFHRMVSIVPPQCFNTTAMCADGWSMFFHEVEADFDRDGLVNLLVHGRSANGRGFLVRYLGGVDATRGDRCVQIPPRSPRL